MKRNNILPIAVMIAMLMASMNLNAQARRAHGDAGRHPQGREMVVRPHGTSHGHAPVMHSHHAAPRPVHHVAPVPMHHRVDRYGYLPDSRWYWYDTYFAPDYYFAHPLGHFHAHFRGHNAAAVAGGVAAGIAVGALIGALAH